MKKINTFEDLEKALRNMGKHLIKTPYPSELHIEVDGTFTSDSPLTLAPHEALLLGQWLVAFYGKKVSK
jgi:hypothetical protein